MDSQINKYSWSSRIVFIVVIAAFAVLAKFSLDNITAAKAYSVCGETWVNAQEELVYNLKLYGATHDDVDYEKFRYFIGVLSDFKSAHRELLLPNPDTEKIKEGFLVSGISSGEVDKIIKFFKQFSDWEKIEKMAEVWEEADLLISGLDKLGTELQAVITSSRNNFAQDIESENIRILGNIAVVNFKLIDLDDSFKYMVTEIYDRVIEKTIYAGMIFGIVVLLVFMLQVIIDRGVLRRSMEFVQRSINRERAQLQIQREELQYAKDSEAVFYDTKLKSSNKAEDFYAKTVAPEKIEEDQRRSGDIFFNAMKQARMAGEAKIQLFADVFNELKVPLMAILGFMEHLKGNVALSEKQEQYLESINDSGRILLTYIDDMWGITKVQNRELLLHEEVFDLEEVISSALTMVKLALLEEDFEIIYNYPEGASRMFRADPIRIRQIVLNLISNAVKKTDEGKISLDVIFNDTGKNRSKTKLKEGTWLVDLLVRYSGEEPFNTGGLEITDEVNKLDVNAIGVNDADKINIAVSKSIAEKMEGSIAVSSGQDSGNEIKATLKLKKAKEEKNDIEEHSIKMKKDFQESLRRANEEARDKPGISFETSDVLKQEPEPSRDIKQEEKPEEYTMETVKLSGMIVDPDNGLTEQIRACLDEAGLEEISSIDPSADTLMKFFSGDKQIPKVMIIDISTGNEGIIDFAKKIRNIDAKGYMTLIAITKDASAGTAKSIREIGFDDYIPKLIIRSDLAYIVKTAVGSRARVKV